MATVKILVNGESVDLQKSTDFPLAFSREAKDAYNLNERAGDRSHTFKLPNTSANRRIFGTLYRPNATHLFYKAAKFDVDIFVDGQPVMTNGLLTIESASIEGIEVSAVAANIGWATLIKDRRLRDIKSLRTFEMVNGTELLAVNAAVDTSDPTVYPHADFYDTVFPLTAYGPFFVPNLWYVVGQKYISQHKYTAGSGGFNADGEIALPAGKEIFGRSTYALGPTNNGGNANFSFLSFPPAVYLRAIIRSIFADIGYSVVGSILDDPEFKKCILLYTGERRPQWPWNNLSKARVVSTPTLPNNRLTLSSFVYNYFNVNIGPGTRLLFVTPYNNTDLLPLEIQTNNAFNFRYGLTSPPRLRFDPYYIVPETGRYRITITLKGQNVTAAAGEGYILLIRNADSDATQWYEGTVLNWVGGAGVFSDKVVGKIILDTSGPINGNYVLEVDLNQFDFLNTVLAALEFNISTDAWVIEEFIWDIQCISSTTALDVAANLPNATQFDFMRWLIRTFNLYFDVNDQTKTAYIDTYNRFFSNSVNAIELRSQTDVYSGEVAPNPQAAAYSFQYQDDGDHLVTQRGGFTRYGSNIINLVRDAQGKQDVEPDFAPTEFDTFSVVTDTANNFLTPVFSVAAQVRIPFITSADLAFQPQNELSQLDSDYDWSPRIVKVKKLVDIGPAYLPFRFWDASQPAATRDQITQVSNYINCVFDDTEVPTGDPIIWSLTFSDTNVLGLYRLFEAQILELQKGHQTEIAIRLTPDLYNRLTIRQLVAIDGGLYRIVSIKGFKPLVGGPTVVVLSRVA